MALRRNLLVGGMVTRKSFLHSFGLVMCGGAYGYCRSPSHWRGMSNHDAVEASAFVVPFHVQHR